MIDATHNTTSAAWDALVAAHAAELSVYQEATDPDAPPFTNAEYQALRARLKLWNDAVLAFPVATADQLLVKTVILEEDCFDKPGALEALACDARRIGNL